MIKIQIKSWLGKVLFEHESENNTIKETLRNAVLSGADLRNADLSNADLSGAVLSNADLSGAVLSGAVLRNAVLSGAVLRNAVLSNADLSGAVLSGAVLSGAVLSNAVLSGADLSGADLSGAFLPIYGHWSSSIVDGKIQIGCKTKTIEDWDIWFAGTEIFTHKRDSETFKLIYANYLAHKAFYLAMNPS